ncbi:MAG: DNA mismatch repair endonuclease MutL [Verrucomicrobiota bacterium]|jgi:DNA mismatch repair protein MutL|nr:DNA mismatch repair endonuclease MutL [Verrucomicrobiota bacterium]
MSLVHLLPDHVANQIAAGEVVERPASVVKELVENAIDAKARRITIEIDNGGRSLIRVTDDGIGMQRDDALMCLERHATSKISAATDLSDIHTMGFRGEALPSIASVSRFTLTSRDQDDASGEATRVIVQGGKMSHVEAAPGPKGSCVEVRQLFFNLPARRKFLKTRETEKAHIQHYLTLAMLAHPEIGFKFIQDQRILWHLNPIETDGSLESRMHGLRERLMFLYSEKTSLLPVEFEDQIRTKVRGDEVEQFEETPIRIWGFTGSPGVSRSTRADQHLFVNQRPVDNKALNFALTEAYHTALMKGKHPVCCLFLEIAPAFVDVNVHPAKKEVRFHNEYAVKQCTIRAVKRCLLKFSMGSSGPHPPSPHEHAEGRTDVPADQTPASMDVALENNQETKPADKGTSLGCQSDVMDLPSFETIPPPAKRQGTSSPGNTQPQAPHGETWKARVHQESTSSTGPTSETSLSDMGSPTPLLAIPMRIIGVLGRLYVLLESDRGLVLMDQHAAHERVLFEQLLEKLERGEIQSQRLLLAETIELSPGDTQFVQDMLPKLQRLGVELSAFGDRTFMLDALPPMVQTKNVRQFILDVIDSLKAAGHMNKMRLSEDVIAKTVCRQAIKANDNLKGPELERLIRDLRACQMPYTCPHGRPTLIEMPFGELEKKFGRIQG